MYKRYDNTLANNAVKNLLILIFTVLFFPSLRDVYQQNSPHARKHTPHLEEGLSAVKTLSARRGWFFAVKRLQAISAFRPFDYLPIRFIERSIAHCDGKSWYSSAQYHSKCKYIYDLVWFFTGPVFPTKMHTKDLIVYISSYVFFILQVLIEVCLSCGWPSAAMKLVKLLWMQPNDGIFLVLVDFMTMMKVFRCFTAVLLFPTLTDG